MDIILILIGFGYIIGKIIQEACIKPVPDDFDVDKAFHDRVANHLSQREYDRRVYSGYYKKDKKDDK